MPLARRAPAGVALALAVAGAFAIRELGLGVTRDGAHYLEVAFALAHGVPTLGNAAYPIGYSALVALAMQAEPFAMDAAALVAQASFLATLLAAAGLLGCAAAPLGPRAGALLASLGVAVVATCPPLVELVLHALSDAPFGALVALHAFALARHALARASGERGADRWLAAAALALGLAVVVRVIGYAPLAVFTLYVALRARDELRASGGAARARALARLAGLHALAWAPVVAIGVGHAFSGSRVHGDRGGSTEPLRLNLERAAATFPHDLGWPLLALVVAALALLAAPRARRSDATAPARWAGAHFAAYVVAIVAAATWTKVSPVGSRFFAPYYALALAPVCALPALVPLAAPRARRAAIALVACVLAGTAVWNARGLARMLAGVRAVESDALTYHDRLGFARSSGVPAVRALLREIAAAPQGVAMTVVAPLWNGGHHAALARTLLFRRVAVASPGEGARFARIDAEHFALALEGGGALRYVDLPVGPSASDALGPETALGAAARVLARDGLASLWVLAPRAVDPLAHVREIAGAPLAIGARREAGAYRAHRIDLVQPSGASVSQ
ncbi:MAG: hypothetical protein R3E88_14225 [Myxococcota bacterium]